MTIHSDSCTGVSRRSGAMAISGNPPGCRRIERQPAAVRRDPRVRHLAGRSRQQWTLRAIAHVDDEKCVEARAEGFDEQGLFIEP